MDPQSFELAGVEPARTVAIEMRLHEGAVGTSDAVVHQERTTVAGRPTVVWEIESQGGEGGVLAPGTRIYQYMVQLGPTIEAGPTLSARTSNVTPDFPSNRDVLDAIMDGLELPGW